MESIHNFLIHKRCGRHYLADLAEWEEPLNIVMRNFQPQIILSSDFCQKPTSLVGIAAVIKSK